MQGPGVSLKIKRLVLLCNQVKSHQEMALGQKKMKRESSALFIKQKKKKKHFPTGLFISYLLPGFQDLTGKLFGCFFALQYNSSCLICLRKRKHYRKASPLPGGRLALSMLVQNM